MRGVEGEVLKIVAELKLVNKEILKRKMAVSSGYVEEICEGLIQDGYLLKKGERYQLTPEGEKAISKVVIKGPVPVLKGGL